MGATVDVSLPHGIRFTLGTGVTRLADESLLVDPTGSRSLHSTNDLLDKAPHFADWSFIAARYIQRHICDPKV